ncbi:hypothetical protein BDR04DRAFT_1098038, partial [Suillus decipiens]
MRKSDTLSSFTCTTRTLQTPPYDIVLRFLDPAALPRSLPVHHPLTSGDDFGREIRLASYALEETRKVPQALLRTVWDKTMLSIFIILQRDLKVGSRSRVSATKLLENQTDVGGSHEY